MKEWLISLCIEVSERTGVDNTQVCKIIADLYAHDWMIVNKDALQSLQDYFDRNP